MVAGLALLVSLPVPAAQALGRKEAAKVALKVLRPQAEKSDRVVVFGLPRPLKPRQSVIESGIAGEAEVQVLTPRPVGRRAWLFWADLDYGAKFRHPSRLVLIDDATGRVLKRQRMTRGWPLVDAKTPPFIRRRGEGDRRYRIYTRLEPEAAPSSLFTHPPAPPPAFASQSNPFPPNTFKDDCLVTLVDRANFEADFQKVTAYFTKLGVRAFEVPRKDASTPPNGADLQRFVKQLTKICKDIIIYTSGHNSSGVAVDVGEAASEGKNGKITKYTQKLTVTNVTNILKENPGTTFKLIVDSCNAGLFLTPEVRAMALVAVAASTANQSSHSGVLFPGVPSNGSTFTYGLVDGMTAKEGEVANDNQPGSTVARLISEGFGAKTDKAALLGLTQPQRSFQDGYGAPKPPPPDPGPGEPPPTIRPINAEFVQGVTFTQYSVTVETSRATIDYAWSVTPPADDPTCNKIEQLSAPRYAKWHHGSADGCTHNTTQHNGVMKVVATVHWPEVPKDWECTAIYNGTLSGTGPEPEPCVAR